MASSFVFLILAFIGFSLAGKNNNTKQVDYCNIKSCPNPKNHILCGKPVDKLQCKGHVVTFTDDDKKKLGEAFDVYRNKVADLRNTLDKVKRPKYKPLVWDNNLARTAQAVANTCKWRNQACVDEMEYKVRVGSGAFRFTPKGTLVDPAGDVKDWYEGEIKQSMEYYGFKNLNYMVQHYTFSFEGPSFGCAGIVADKEGPLFYCHYLQNY